MEMEDIIIKYPRTPHIQGSRLQPGDEDLSQRPFSDIAGKYIVLEEKIDGANSAISFTDDGELRLQSRGHFLTGGYRERHYDLMKQWGAVQKDRLYAVLGHRYIMYGEWMFAKHSIYYDELPHYFMEFDVLDRENDKFLDTPSRCYLKRVAEARKLLGHGRIGVARMLEGELIVKSLANEISLAHAPPSIDCAKLGFFLFQKIPQGKLLFFSPD